MNAASRDASTINATVAAAVNFATRTMSFTTSATTSLSANAAAGVLPIANTSLNFSGTLNYIAGSNTFTGAVISVGGLTGNATCRFYGPAIAAATGNKVLGLPTEIGCTFAADNTAIGVVQGALGAN